MTDNSPEIGDAIIAGIASGDGPLEQMSEIVSHLERAGFAIVPDAAAPRSELPMLKPPPGELVIECPRCGERVSETCCAFQDYDYYKNCYHWITRRLREGQRAEP